MICHRIYGLLFETTQALPGLPILSSTGIVDVRICLQCEKSPLVIYDFPPQTFYLSEFTDDNRQPLLRAGFLGDGTYLSLVYSDGARFALERHGKEVFADWPISLTLEDVAPYFVGPVLGVVLRLRGMVPLHASAVAIGEHAIAIAGPAGAGKSTTAAAFARRGYRVISDDVVVLQEEAARFVVPPGYPRVNLWSESVLAILGADGALPLISPSWGKHFMPLDPRDEFEARCLPLAGIYVLQNRQSELRGPVLREVSGTEAFMALLGNTYMNYLPDPEKRRQEFELLGRVVARVPIRLVQTAPDLSTLPDLCEAISADAWCILGKGSAPPRKEFLHLGSS
jgi:hypothetical protein